MNKDRRNRLNEVFMQLKSLDLELQGILKECGYDLSTGNWCQNELSAEDENDLNNIVEIAAGVMGAVDEYYEVD